MVKNHEEKSALCLSISNVQRVPCFVEFENSVQNYGEGERSMLFVLVGHDKSVQGQNGGA